MITANPLSNTRGKLRFTDNALNEHVSIYQKYSSALDERKIPFLYVIVPGKENVYPEYLSDEITITHQPRSREQLVTSLSKKSNFPTLDLTKTLLHAKKKKQIYFKNDTHWNQMGAYVGYVQIMQELQKVSSEIFRTAYTL